MSNSLVTIDMITREALRVAHEQLSFIGTINRQYDKSFGKTGAKIGDTLRIREPNQYTRRQGSRVMDVQDQAESSKTLTVATQDGVDMRFNSAEMATDIDDFSKRYIEPAVKVMVSGIEGDVIAALTKNVYNWVGTAGTPPNDLVEWGEARAKLNQNLAPKDGNRYIQAGSTTMGTMVNGLSGLFQDSKQIKEQYREGMMGRTAGFDWYENEKMYSHANSADVVGDINNGDLDSGTTTLTTTLLTAAPTEGSVFTIAGVYDCHPETKQAYSHLKQFVVGAGATTTSVPFTPACIHSTTDAKQNCSGAPVDAAAVTFEGDATNSRAQNLAYHKDAFTFVTADLPIMDDGLKCVRREQDGLSLRCWQASDIRNDEMLLRLDILYGYLATRPEWACRVTD